MNRNTNKVMTPELESKAKELRAQGKNYVEIAKRLGIPYPTVHHHLSRKSEEWRKHRSEWVQAWYKTHPEEYKKSGRHKPGYEDKQAPKTRIAIIKLMGGQCSRCGNDDARVLQVHHINGHGREELRKYRSAYTFYRAVLRGDRSREDLDLLCCNCNILHEYEQGGRKGPSLMYRRAVRLLGEKCAKCGCNDMRVLQLNHVDGKDSSSFNQWEFYRAVAGGDSVGINLLCANCNTLYEYERGKRRDIRQY